jgi:hypothetical protein
MRITGSEFLEKSCDKVCEYQLFYYKFSPLNPPNGDLTDCGATSIFKSPFGGFRGLPLRYHKTFERGVEKRVDRGPNVMRHAFLWTSLFAMILMTSLSWGEPTTFLPLNHRAYDFLDRMELGGLVTGARLGAKPITRARAAELLVAVEREKQRLTPVDRDELACLMDEFAPDIPERRGLAWGDKGPVKGVPGLLSGIFYRNRRNLLASSGEDYSLYFDPIIVRSGTVGTLKTPEKDERVYLESHGVVIRGTAGGNIGYYIDVRDSREEGSREYLPEGPATLPGRGYVHFMGDHVEFDETNSGITYSSGPFVIFWGRGENIWGRGLQGTLGISGYASPHDMLRVQAEFWRLRYTFIAAELKQYPAIAEYYYNPPAGVSKDSVTVHKRLSGNRLEVDLTDRLNIGLYETVVYGGRSEFNYLNPVMFLRGAEHTNGDHDNAMMGADFRLIVHRSHSIYGEFLIDDITTGRLGTNWYGNKFGWQLGTFLVNPFNLDDTDIRVEYTRIKPWVYTHRYPIDVYDHYGSVLGYHTGPNSDEFSAEIRKRFSRRLNMSLSFVRARHGANPPGTNIGGDLLSGFRSGDPTKSHFLDGIVDRRTVTGIDISYEPLWQLFVKAGCAYEDRDGKANRLIRFSLGLNE